MKSRLLPIVALFVLSVALSCTNSYRAGSLVYQQYRISSNQAKDARLQSVIQVYSDSVNSTMNKVIGITEETLEKSMPQSTLGYFMVDAFYTMAKQKFNTRVDVAFMNYGGIRLTQLPAGNITVGKIFEMMPFDNLLILQRMKGKDLQALIDHIAMKGGWPVAGMTMRIKDKKPFDVLIDGKPLNPESEYTVANSDFVANGGDEAWMLRSIKQENIGYLMRDALFDYIKLLQSQGKNVTATKEIRVKKDE